MLKKILVLGVLSGLAVTVCSCDLFSKPDRTGCDYLMKMGAMLAAEKEFQKNMAATDWSDLDALPGNVITMDEGIENLIAMRRSFENEVSGLLKGDLYGVHNVFMDILTNDIEAVQITSMQIKQWMAAPPSDEERQAAQEELGKYKVRYNALVIKLAEAISKVDARKFEECPVQKQIILFPH